MQPSQILDPVGRDFQMCQGCAKDVQPWHQLMMISLWGHFQVSWLPATKPDRSNSSKRHSKPFQGSVTETSPHTAIPELSKSLCCLVTQRYQICVATGVAQSAITHRSGSVISTDQPCTARILEEVIKNCYAVYRKYSFHIWRASSGSHILHTADVTSI